VIKVSQVHRQQVVSTKPVYVKNGPIDGNVSEAVIGWPKSAPKVVVAVVIRQSLTDHNPNHVRKQEINNHLFISD
jgi:hypothetical protein